LHEAFSEGYFAYDEAAVVILNGSGYDFSGGGGASIDEDYERIIFSTVAVALRNAFQVRSVRGGRR
jgi:hypothetical protein